MLGERISSLEIQASKSSCTGFDLWERPTKGSSVVPQLLEPGGRTSPSHGRLFLVVCHSVAASVNVTSRGPCFYLSADIRVAPIGPVLVTAAHSAKRLWLLFNVQHGEPLPTWCIHCWEVTLARGLP